MRAEGSEKKKRKGGNMRMLRWRPIARRRKERDEKSDPVACYIHVLFHFQFFVLDTEEIPLTGGPPCAPGAPGATM